MNKKLGRLISAFWVLGWLVIVPVYAQEDSDDRNGVWLYREFRKAIKEKCGDRSEAVRLGKLIIERYSADELNKDVVAYLKQKVPQIEKEDTVCRRESAYIGVFQTKDWAQVWATGKAIIDAEGNSPKALDVMLDLVSVGYDRAFVDKNNTFTGDTLLYAKLAIERIEAGQTSNSGIYGAFVPFKTKDEALVWMNYIAGWLMYNKLNRQRDALAYFFKAAQIGVQNNQRLDIYANIGKYYFDEAARLDTEYREKLAANNDEESVETGALAALARGTAERAMIFYARALQIGTGEASMRTTNLRRALSDLYRFRFNTDKYDTADFERFFEDLIKRPLPDFSTPVQPVLEEPVDVRIKRNKLQKIF